LKKKFLFWIWGFLWATSQWGCVFCLFDQVYVALVTNSTNHRLVHFFGI